MIYTSNIMPHTLSQIDLNLALTFSKEGKMI